MVKRLRCNMETRYEELIGLATKLILERGDNDRHTVGCCVLACSGKKYFGVNMYMDGMNCVCAEQNAIGTALTAGEKDFEAIVSVGLFDDKCQILSPCGQCRQFLSKYAPNIRVIVKGENGTEIHTIAELLPFSYKMHHVKCD